MSIPRRTSCTSFSTSRTRPASSSAFPLTSSPAFLRRSNRRSLRCSASAPSASSNSEPKRRQQRRKVLIDLTLDKFASRHPHRCDIVRYLFGGLLLELGAALEVPSHGTSGLSTPSTSSGNIATLSNKLSARSDLATIHGRLPIPSSFCKSLVDDGICIECGLPERVRMFGARPYSHRDIGAGNAASSLYDTPREGNLLSFGVFARFPFHTVLQAAPRGTTPETFRSNAPRDKWVELPPNR